jgi:phosphoribosylaminoimidazole-succinocarboxamide synthase
MALIPRSAQQLLVGLSIVPKQGKVRDNYDLGDQLLMVATDRISAFDVVMPTLIPDKGKILTAMSLFWFFKTADLVANHLITADVEDYPAWINPPIRRQLDGRSMLVRKAKVVPIECVARGYLAGSGWKEYQKTQMVCGVSLPPMLRQCDKLPEPIFTPATKEEDGHDQNIDFTEMVRRVGEPLALRLGRLTLDLYKLAAEYALSKGIIIADTKFEFGVLPDGQVILIDEILTPDSSRFWPADRYAPGRDQESFDKQYVRNYLQGEVDAGRWNKEPPAPTLPQEVVNNTRRKYLEALKLLTSMVFDPQ